MPDRTLKLKDQGADVAEAQDLLNRFGAIIDADGEFGDGTAFAVREFRLANKMPDTGLIDDPLWQRLRSLPVPNADIPTQAVSFIARAEVGGRHFYDTQCAKPTWPHGDSGVTIGVGYDLGYQADFERDWSDLLTPDQIARLKPWVGKKGEAAKPGPAQLVDLVIPWHAAWQGYVRRTLPQEVVKTRGAFVPAPRPLPALCLGMLVSLVYNRGAAMTDSTTDDRRREMRQIRDAVAAGRYEAVPAALLAMRRLWPDDKGLRDRREREAKLFEAGLAER
jgi:GH24 family phage-related lysozyme (muramidase)